MFTDEEVYQIDDDDDDELDETNGLGETIDSVEDEGTMTSPNCGTLLLRQNKIYVRFLLHTGQNYGRSDLFFSIKIY